MVEELAEEGDELCEAAAREQVAGLAAEHVGDEPGGREGAASRNTGRGAAVVGVMRHGDGAPQLVARVGARAVDGAEVRVARAVVGALELWFARLQRIEDDGAAAVRARRLRARGVQQQEEQEKEEVEVEERGRDGIRHVAGLAAARGLRKVREGGGRRGAVQAGRWGG